MIIFHGGSNGDDGFTDGGIGWRRRGVDVADDTSSE
jgi:hypothetical protein